MKAAALMARIAAAQDVVLAGADPDDIHRARYALYDIAAAALDPDLVAELAGDADLRARSAKVFAAACQAGIAEEQQVAASLLAEGAGFDVLYDRYYGDVYDRLMAAEWLLLGPDVPRRIAYVGGGALPLPALLLARQHGVAVTVVEADEASVSLANELAARMGLAHLVTAHHADGADFDYGDLPALWMANWVPGKAGIFGHLARFPGLRLAVVRAAAPGSLSFLINDPVDPAIGHDAGFTDIARTPRQPGLSLVSLLLRRPLLTDLVRS